MCLAFFRGKGYSGGFTAHMAQVKETLAQDPAVRLALTQAVAALTGLGSDRITVCKGS